MDFQKYKFTKNWFVPISNLLKHIKSGTDDELHFLEIGCFEGKSTVWFIDNFLKNEKSTITCIDPWMNFYQNSNSFNTYNPETKTASDIDYINDGVKDRFLHNIKLTEKSNQVEVIQQLSHIQLPKMIDSCREKYNVIYIDGNHTAPFVLTDAVMSWYLLKPNGIIVFDDYQWSTDDNPRNKPKMAVDYFVDCFGDYLEILWEGPRYAIKKIEI